jgi:hypothetical protein
MENSSLAVEGQDVWAVCPKKPTHWVTSGKTTEGESLVSTLAIHFFLEKATTLLKVLNSLMPLLSLRYIHCLSSMQSLWVSMIFPED